jgi:hypothetical protein
MLLIMKNSHHTNKLAGPCLMSYHPSLLLHTQEAAESKFNARYRLETEILSL